MNFKMTLIMSAVLAQQAFSAPRLESRQIFKSVTPLNTAILFDSPAFQDPNNPTNYVASFRSFVYLNHISLSGFTNLLAKFLDGLGIEVGDSMNILKDRVRLFAAVGLPGKVVDINISGCSTSITAARLAATEFLPNLGMLEQKADVGSCAKEPLAAKVKLSSFDGRDFGAVVFPSPPTGFGVISDVDDTIKITNVLDKAATVRSIFLEESKFVPGMPELFKALKTTLDSPQFIYVSGSPFQLYPALRSFVNTYYQPGPILLQNLTFVNIPGVLDFVQGATAGYKSERIDMIHSWYPRKSFVTIGDSTQADPEIYGAAYNKFGGNFIQCIWIRMVDGANNTQQRFAAAFMGVPPTRIRVFDDPTELVGIQVPAGQC